MSTVKTNNPNPATMKSSDSPKMSTSGLPPLTIPQSLACGAVARTSQIISMYPVDTLKTRIQVSRAAASPLQTLSSALRAGNLYRGAGFSLLGQIPYGMLTFGLYETLLTTFGTSPLPAWTHIILAAALGDTVGSLWLTPSEVIKSKTQAGMYSTPLQAARATFGNGVGGMYQGYGAAIARDVPFRMVQMMLYERLRTWFRKLKAADLQPVENLFVGALAGTMTAAITTPLDVVRTRMMTGGEYRNVWLCVRGTIQKEGLGGLFRGVVPRCMVIGPSSAVFFLAYEASKGFFRQRARRMVAQTTKVRYRVVWA